MLFSVEKERIVNALKDRFKVSLVFFLENSSMSEYKMDGLGCQKVYWIKIRPDLSIATDIDLRSIETKEIIDLIYQNLECDSDDFQHLVVKYIKDNHLILIKTTLSELDLPKTTKEKLHQCRFKNVFDFLSVLMKQDSIYRLKIHQDHIGWRNVALIVSALKRKNLFPNM